MQQIALIPHEIEKTMIYQRAIDGYVNATAMCKAVGKKFNDYSRLGSTKEFFNELSTVTGIPATELIQTLSGGEASTQGSWVHPDIAVHLAQWCSPKFAVAVAKWVREWLTGESRATNLPYHVARYMANRSAVPVTHFSMLNELLFGLIAPLESVGYTIPDDMVPDISTGRMFCKWLRDEKGIDTDTLPTYRHVFEDGRVVYPKLYPNEVLADFRRHFHEVWMPTKAESYFGDRDPKAIEFLQKAIPAPASPSLVKIRRPIAIASGEEED